MTLTASGKQTTEGVEGRQPAAADCLVVVVQIQRLRDEISHGAPTGTGSQRRDVHFVHKLLESDDFYMTALIPL